MTKYFMMECVTGGEKLMTKEAWDEGKLWCPYVGTGMPLS